MSQLSKRYKNKMILEDLNVSLEGGMVGLIGPNGAGKTTFMRLLSAVSAPTSGDITVNGYSMKHKASHVRKHIGYLPQHFQLYPQLTAAQFLDYVGNLKSNGKCDHEKEKSWLLNALNLNDQKNQKIKTFSNGMRQRLGIAQALYGEPDIIIFDEPSAGLDPEERLRFRNLMADVSSRKMVILSTHIVEDIEASCDTLIVLNNGRILFQGTPAELQNKGNGVVWEFNLVGENWNMLSGLQATLTKRTSEGLHCRVISPVAPFPFAEASDPTLEEGYMALIGRDHL
ncbi:ABC transporter ATP-binding protein [Pseudalkalibacillus hwajinpoensis]|uniref:ABC transporter ATP-binding protein n=1 Tax=Guptibacillus hwajinpoensis TaxID=208199 RepID=UPI00325A7FE9